MTSHGPLLIDELLHAWRAVRLRWQQLPARGPAFGAYRDLTLRIRATYERFQYDHP